MFRENRTLDKIFEEVGRQNTEQLKDNSLLLDYDSNQSFQEQSLDAQMQAAFRDDKSHTSKLSENES